MCVCFCLFVYDYSVFLSCLTEKRRASDSPGALPALCRTRGVGAVEESATGARQKFTVIIP
jgi:hypothetical protein